MSIKLSKGPALTQADLGSPLAPEGTGYLVCVYDDMGALAQELRVDRAGETCGQKPCWKAIGGTPGGKGWIYKDGEATSDGVRVLSLKGGPAGGSKITLKASNKAQKGQRSLPLGAPLQLYGTSGVTVQLLGEGLSACQSVTLDNVTRDLGTYFSAKK